MNTLGLLQDSVTSRVTLADAGTSGLVVVRHLFPPPGGVRGSWEAIRYAHDISLKSVQPLLHVEAEADGSYTCISPWIAGYPLTHLPLTRLPLGVVRNWIVQLLEGMSALHQVGCFLSTLRPEDVVCTAEQATLVDLALWEAVYGLPHRPPGGIGVPEGVPSAAGNVFLAGALAWWLLCGRFPRVDSHTSSTVLKDEAAALRPDLPPQVLLTLLGLLDYHPLTRPQTAAETAMLLRSLRLEPVPQPVFPTPTTAEMTWLHPDAGLRAPPTRRAEPAVLARRKVPSSVGLPSAPLRRPRRLFGPTVLERRREMAVVVRELAVMSDAGLVLPQALDLVARTSPNEAIARAFRDARLAVEGGMSLAAAFKPHRPVLGALTLQMLEIGERSGCLPQVLNRLAAFLEKESSLAGKVQAALTYPLFVFGVCMVVLTCLPFVMLRTLLAMLETSGGTLPWSTRVMMGASRWLTDGWTWAAMALGMVLAVMAYRQLKKSMAFELWRDRLLLRLPVVGPLVQYVAMVYFGLALDTMYASGVPIVEALRSAGGSTGNKVMEQAACQAGDAMLGGDGLAQSLRKSGMFPRLLTNMVAAGEESGEVDTMLQHAVSMALVEVDARLNSAVATLEPVMLWFMGCFVAFIVVAALGPVLQMLQRLG